MPGRSFVGANGYRFGFNGKEKDNEAKGNGNSYDYGARIYDPRIGRFLSTDPITKTFSMLSPYQYASNTPIMAIDLDGKEAWVVVWGSQSKDTDGDGQPQIGHAGIVVKNYIAVQSQVEGYALQKDGAMVKTQATVTTYISDGTYTYYDLWPGTSADLTDPHESVTPNYQKKTFKFNTDTELEAYLKANDISKTSENGPREGYAPDGVLKINPGASLVVGIKKSLDEQKASNQDYSPVGNNCTSNVSNALNANGISITKEANTVFIAGYKKGVNPFQSFDTPNNLYKALAKKANVTVVKDAGNAVSQDYEDAIVDPAIDAQKGN